MRWHRNCRLYDDQGSARKKAADDDDEAHAANHGRIGKDLFDSWYAEEVDTVDI